MQQESPQRGPGRPPAASRDAVEKAALSLMLREGYANVSVEKIVAEAGISRTTLFRYFGSKPGIIWQAFDDTIIWLETELRAPGNQEAAPVESACAGIVASARLALSSSDMWLQRFELLDNSPDLRAGAYDHWEQWKNVVAEYLASRAGHNNGDAAPMAVAAALQAVFVSSLRDRAAADNDREKFLERLNKMLASLSPGLGIVLSGGSRQLQ